MGKKISIFVIFFLIISLFFFYLKKTNVQETTKIEEETFEKETYNSNIMIISRNVVYTNLENILKADVMEINISNKDTKIFMFKDNKKVNIKSKE
jgi:hypothetical protein